MEIVESTGVEGRRGRILVLPEPSGPELGEYADLPGVPVARHAADLFQTGQAKHHSKVRQIVS
jgi:hypothetical protein